MVWASRIAEPFAGPDRFGDLDVGIGEFSRLPAALRWAMVRRPWMIGVVRGPDPSTKFDEGRRFWGFDTPGEIPFSSFSDSVTRTGVFMVFFQVVALGVASAFHSRYYTSWRCSLMKISGFRNRCVRSGPRVVP